MNKLQSFLRYLWGGLGGQMAEFSFTVTGKIPAQITMAGFVVAALLTALTALAFILTLLFGWEVRAPPAHATPTPNMWEVGGSLGGPIN